MKARVLAIKVVDEVLSHGRSLSTALPKLLPRADEGERGLCQELSYGLLRHYLTLDAIAAQLMDKPLKAKDHDIHLLILLGLYQILHLRIPDHAAVSATVESVKALKKPWARGLINGVLRNFLRNREELLQQVAQNHSSHYAHPQWFISAVRRSWPEQWAAILEANNQYPPFTLRCNARQVQREDYLQQLDEVELSATATAHTEQGITLEQACPVERLPGFEQGRASVQDGAAQLAAQLLNAQAGDKVLDACAAPGGKLAHILERQPDCQVTAVDIDAQRVERIEQNLQRLQLRAEVLTADVAATDQWWDGEPFDRILLDAPCSATGVIRRHPDIKQLRTAGDIEQLARLQAQILDALWPTLKPGGQMVYATCSVMAEENSLQVAGFLSRHKDARELPLEVTWGHACEVGRQILPGEDGMDGFYYAILQKA